MDCGGVASGQAMSALTPRAAFASDLCPGAAGGVILPELAKP
jgi:hypothetical protein